MPVLDGYQTTTLIREGKAGKMWRDVPIVAMTANAMVGDRQKCIDAGMNDYISKPINPDKLTQKIIEVIKDKTKPPNFGEVKSKTMVVHD